jgi:putative ABC transport system ATP-binding protein
MILFRDVSKIYRRGRTEVEALREVTLEINEGEFVAVVGPSGSGKSTLLQLAGALDKPTKGTVSVAGQELGALDDDALTGLRRKTIGFVFQFFNLLPTLSARENAMLPALLAGVGEAEARARTDALLAEVGLQDRAEHTPDELSGGQMQRAAIARALVTAPRLLLADEPTGNLDTHTGAEMLQLLRELSRKRGVTVVMVTHDQKAASAADRVIQLEDGRVV